jgi:hypothetical protein
MDEQIREGWLVIGEMQTDEESLREWKAKNLNFADLRPSIGIDWSKHIVANGSEERHMCGGVDTRMLFDSEEAAREYGKRDAAIASGLRRIERTFFIDARGVRDIAEGYFPDEVLETEAATSWEGRWDEVRDSLSGEFYDSKIFLFESREAAETAVRELTELERILAAGFARRKGVTG